MAYGINRRHQTRVYTVINTVAYYKRDALKTVVEPIRTTETSTQTKHIRWTVDTHLLPAE